ncbi:hypothetical protein V8J88_21145 [Massilia sp. W12]|uniref:hypothetical protein n=1 Tax=Massilia sp. W12 TaxID=3126507 RepID=UPI0030D52748
MPLSSSTAYTALVANPVNFLKTYTLRLAGVGNKPSAEYEVALGAYSADEAPIVLKSGANGQFFKMGPSGAIKDGAHQTLVHVVRMDPNANEIKPYTLGGNGSSVMITGELTGCCFIVWNKGQSVKVAHVNPSGFKAADLRAFLKEEHPGAQIVYGHEEDENERGMYGDNRTVSIFGVRGADGQWRLYAQKRERDTQKFCSLYQIYPEHSKM